MATNQFITNYKNEKISVILPIKSSQKMPDELEKPKYIRLFDGVKEKDDGERLFFSDY